MRYYLGIASVLKGMTVMAETSRFFSNKVTTDNPRLLDINHFGCLVGIMDSINLVEIIDSLLGEKQAYNVKISYGQALACYVLYLLQGTEYHGLYGISEFVKNTSVCKMLNIQDCSAVNRDVIASTLDAIAMYGPSELTMQVSSQIISPEQVRLVNADSTSKYNCGRVRGEFDQEDAEEQSTEGIDKTEDNRKPLRKTKLAEAMEQLRFINDREGIVITYGHSRDHRDDLPQVNIIMISTRVPYLNTAIPIWSSCFDGNQNDISRFSQFANVELPFIKQKFFNLETIVMDSAGAYAETARAVHELDMTMLSRLPDARKEAQDAFNKIGNGELHPESFKVKDDDDQEVEVKMTFIDNYYFKSKTSNLTVPCKALLVVADSLKDKKTKLINKKAKAEKNRVIAALKKFNRNPPACRPDADKQFELATSNLIFCKVSKPIYTEHKHYDKRGKPSKDAEPASLSYTVEAEVTIDEEVVQRKIERELLYIILSTNMSLNEVEIYNQYHGQIDIEKCWQEMKMPEFYVNTLFLKSPHRIRALVAIITIAMMVARIFMSKVKSALNKHSLCLEYPNGKRTTTPGLSLVLRRIKKGSPITLILNPHGSSFITNVIEDSLIDFIMQEIGTHCFKYYDPKFYDEDKEKLLALAQLENVEERKKNEGFNAPDPDEDDEVLCRLVKL